jgi:hypothetical protein
MSFPDLPFIPNLPGHRVENMTVGQVLGQASAALHAARGALYDVEHGAQANRQLANIRQVVLESRRSTFVLQKLSSRVDSWAEWWAPRQAALRADALMRYFADLRTVIEKEGLPAAMAEIYDIETGETLADVACGEDQFGVWVSGAVRPAATAGGLEPGAYRDPGSIALRNFRLPDPPLEHDARRLTDFRFVTLAELAITYLADQVLRPAIAEFEGVTS